MQDVARKKCRERWTIETGDERGSGRSMLAVRHCCILLVAIIIINHNCTYTNANTGKYNRMQIQNTKTNTGRLSCSGKNGFINFWLWFFDTRRETQFLLCWPYYLNPPTRGASLSVEIRKTQLNLHWSKSNLNFWQKLNCLPPWSNLKSQLSLFQNPQFLRTISSGHDVIHTPVHFLSGVIMTMVILFTQTLHSGRIWHKVNF